MLEEHSFQGAECAANGVGAGAAHSACVDSDGGVLAWRSADPGLHVQQVGGALEGRRVVAVSAGAPAWTPLLPPDMPSPLLQTAHLLCFRMPV